ncbi:MAG: hypothetical protein WBB23_25125, partial [Desulforhopalus sp.]
MSKKRKSFREYKHHEKNHPSRPKNRNEIYSTLENMVLAQIYTATTPLSFAQLLGAIPQNNHSADDVKAALDSLIQAGLVYKDGKKQFRIHKKALLYEGT